MLLGGGATAYTSPYISSAVSTSETCSGPPSPTTSPVSLTPLTLVQSLPPPIALDGSHHHQVSISLSVVSVFQKASLFSNWKYILRVVKNVLAFWNSRFLNCCEIVIFRDLINYIIWRPPRPLHPLRRRWIISTIITLSLTRTTASAWCTENCRFFGKKGTLKYRSKQNQELNLYS